MIGGVKHVAVNEGQEETFLELFRTLKSEMARHEPGNLYYDLYRSRKPPPSSRCRKKDRELCRQDLTRRG